MTWRCPRAAAQPNSSRTPGAQPPGPLELRGLCDLSQPREREALARWGWGRSPPWNGGQERVTLREQRAVASSPALPPAPRHVATEACAASVLAGPAGAGVGLGQDPRPGRHLGLLRRNWACGAWEEGMAEANVTLAGGLPAPPLPAQGKPRTDGERQI